MPSTTRTGFYRDPAGNAYLGGFRLDRALKMPELKTPCYLYDLDGIEDGVRALVEIIGSPNTVAYAMKANSAGSVLRRVASAGAGADVVSGAELELALSCGVPSGKIVMSGVAKSDAELDFAITQGILALQVESVEELSRIAARAQAVGRPARVSPRLNPSVEIDSHAHIATGHDEAKFGILLNDLDRAWTLIDGSEWLSAVGISSHIGSMLRQTDAYLTAARLLCQVALARRAAGKPFSYVNFGGGFGVDYGGGAVTPPTEFARAALSLRDEMGLQETPLCIEPGRSIVAPYGVLLAKVTQQKVTSTGRWLMLDAGMNDLIRPALYQAKHRIEPLSQDPSGLPWRVVGPVCESSDDFGWHTVSDSPPEYVVLREAGAYGYVMASEYNGRPLPAEVFISNSEIAKVSAPRSAQRWIAERLDA
ncbi:MAG: hypothetical protein RJA70_2532 [Pseudomonadota bacterium]|jgi:diaminopimelate decarboxylase